MNAFTKEDLKRFQAESLDDKFQRTLAKVSEWFSYWNNEVYVSFSGGKDSTVLADICARWCKIIGKPLYLVFVNTGLEYPEIQKHVKFFAQWLRDKYGIEVELEILRPKMRFDEVIKNTVIRLLESVRQMQLVSREKILKTIYILCVWHFSELPLKKRKPRGCDCRHLNCLTATRKRRISQNLTCTNTEIY